MAITCETALRDGLWLSVPLYGLIHFSNSVDLYSSSFWTLKPKLYWSHLVCWPNYANISFGFELCLMWVVPLDSAQNSGLVELKNHRNRTSIEVYRPCFLFSMQKKNVPAGRRAFVRPTQPRPEVPFFRGFFGHLLKMVLYPLILMPIPWFLISSGSEFGGEYDGTYDWQSLSKMKKIFPQFCFIIQQD